MKVKLNYEYFNNMGYWRYNKDNDVYNYGYDNDLWYILSLKIQNNLYIIFSIFYKFQNIYEIKTTLEQIDNEPYIPELVELYNKIENDIKIVPAQKFLLDNNILIKDEL